MIHTAKGFSKVSEAEVRFILEFPCIFCDLAYAANLISGSSIFSKSSLYIWKFLIYVLLTPSLKDFEHYFASEGDECNCAVVSTFFSISFFGIGMKPDLFQSCGHCQVSQICWHIECSTLTASSFRTWNSSAGTPSPPLAPCSSNCVYWSPSRSMAAGDILHHLHQPSLTKEMVAVFFYRRGKLKLFEVKEI